MEKVLINRMSRLVVILTVQINAFCLTSSNIVFTLFTESEVISITVLIPGVIIIIIAIIIHIVRKKEGEENINNMNSNHQTYC